MEREQELYKVSEVAAILRTSVNNVYSLIHSGKLKAVNLGRYTVRKSDLKHFIDNLPVASR